VTEKGGSDALAVPSDTEIVMPLYVPAWVLAGVPDSDPVALLKLAHAGLFVIENVSVSPSGSEALGWKA